jgi:hypothetical protein
MFLLTYIVLDGGSGDTENWLFSLLLFSVVDDLKKDILRSIPLLNIKLKTQISAQEQLGQFVGLKEFGGISWHSISQIKIVVDLERIQLEGTVRKSKKQNKNRCSWARPTIRHCSRTKVATAGTMAAPTVFDCRRGCSGRNVRESE